MHQEECKHVQKTPSNVVRHVRAVQWEMMDTNLNAAASPADAHKHTHARSVKRTKHGSWTRPWRGTPTCRLPQTQTEATPWPAHDGESRLWRHTTRRADQHADRDKLLTSLLDPAFLNDGDIAHDASVTQYPPPLLHTSSWRSEEGGGEERRGEGGQLSQPQRLSPSLTGALGLSLSVVLAGCLLLSLSSLSKAVCSGFPLLPLLFSLALSPWCCLPLSLDLPTPRQWLSLKET